MGLLTDLLGDGNATSAATQLLHVRDEKASGTQGGTFTSGAWQTRTLNTVKTNEISGASLATNQVTLPAGTYEVDGSTPCYNGQQHQARLYDVTAAAALLLGSSAHADAANNVMNYSLIRGRFTLAVQSEVRLEHRCTSTLATTGFGLATSFGTEVYADLMIRKVA